MTEYEKRLRAAYETAAKTLLDNRTEDGHWVGQLSLSPLSTATAISALSLFRKATNLTNLDDVIADGVKWLLSQQNSDGGWGDTDKSFSNISTTMLVKSALTLASGNAGILPACISVQAEIEAIKARYGADKTFSVPILTNAALAGLVSWDEIEPLPFERAALPQSLFRFLNLQVVSYAIPALVAIGQAHFHHKPPKNPVTRFLRQRAIEPTLKKVLAMQPESGGFLEATPLTAFVAMSLISCGRAEHPIVQNCIRFLLESVSEDGAWPIDTNLSVWVTTLAINALGSRDVSSLDFILSAQHKDQHPFTGSAAGGWAWTNLSGGVPDADDTAGAILALNQYVDASPAAKNAGTKWLLGLQNRDGGWPTFCRGWGVLPFDKSGTDLTAHVIRALLTKKGAVNKNWRVNTAIVCGIKFLLKNQQKNGSWIPLWFGSQHNPNDENPIYGTAKVLLVLSELSSSASLHPAIERGRNWLKNAQNADGSFGHSVEETAVAVEALAKSDGHSETLEKATRWLITAVENGKFTEPSPIGLYFAKLWYYEKLYPIIFTVAALGAVISSISDDSGLH